VTQTVGSPGSSRRCHGHIGHGAWAGVHLSVSRLASGRAGIRFEGPEMVENQRAKKVESGVTEPLGARGEARDQCALSQMATGDCVRSRERVERDSSCTVALMSIHL
jgi:hypothetical protein